MRSALRKWRVLAVMGLVLLVCFLCTQGSGAQQATLPGPIQSSPITLTPDNRFVICVNPDSNTITLISPTQNGGQVVGTVTVGNNPVSVAAHPNNNLVYVANALDGTVAVVNLLTRTVSKTIAVGSEPSAVAISPNGTLLYVANSASNSLSVIGTATNTVTATVDLSPFGTAPRAIAVTNNGNTNDLDETIFVAMFYGQLRAGKNFLNEGQDDQREGHVVAISAATNTVLAAPNPVVFAPMANTGFNSNGQLSPAPGQVPAVASTNPQTFTTPTGAFPNQLAAIALHPSQTVGYVVSTGASPNGPFKFNVNNQGLVSVFNVAGRTEVTAAQTDPNVVRTAPLNLNQGVNLATTPAPRFFYTNPVAMAWRPNGSDAWVVIQNSDVVVRLTIDANGIPTVGAPVAGPSQITHVDLQAVTGTQIAGKAPRGIAINSAGTKAYTYNYVTRSVTEITITNGTAPAITNTFQASALPAAATNDATALLGAQLFFSGRGPQGRMSNTSWGSCIVCHPNGRSDNVTWMFDTGPRQTIALDGTFNRANPNDQRILNWSAVRDEIHDFELNTRNVFGGQGLIDDDRLFLAVGGTSGAVPTDSALIEQFQQFTGVVGTTNDLASGAALPALLGGGRRDFALATYGGGAGGVDDRILIIGGRSGAGQGSLITGANTVLEFNPRTNVVRTRSSTGFTPRHSLGAAAVQTSQGTRVYAIGGYNATAATTNPVATVEEYNPSTDSWRTVAALPTAVAQYGIAVAGGINTAEPLQLIHVVSGNTSSEGTPSVANPNPVQRFQPDPAGPGTWSAFANPGLTLRRNLGAAVALRGVQSRIFVIGGIDATGNPSTLVEEYLAQAVIPQASTHTPLPTALAHFGIGSTVSSNQIYVMGGVNAAGVDQTAILEYTVSTNGPTAGLAGTPSGAWVTRGNLSVARRGLQASSPPGVTNFLPVANAGRSTNQNAIATWVALKVRSAKAPVPASDPGAQAGRTLFGTVGLVNAGVSCATCHGGPKWTRSSVDYTAPPSPEVGLGLGNQRVIGAELRQTVTQPNLFPNVALGSGQFPGVLVNVGTFTLGGGRMNEVRVNPADPGQAIAPLGANGFNIPSLLSVHETAPYFYSGLAQTLSNVLDGSQDGNGGTQVHFVANATQRAQLVQFLRSIDQTTPTFP